MAKLVKTIKLNNLQYNPNRGPEAYRRCVGDPFRIQALLDGEGSARVTLCASDGSRLGEAKVGLPGTFVQELRFPAPGRRSVTLKVEGDGQTFTQELRLEVAEHAMQA